MTEVLQVAAAVVFGADGRVLIARRPAQVHQGGLWEFPGGKLEPGETSRAALVRELWEELGIRPTRFRRLIRVPHRYPDRSVLLDVWRVDAYEGVPVGRQGQPLRWVVPEQLGDYSFPAANLPIVNAARLPDRYLITPDCTDPADLLERLRAAVSSGIRLVQLRCPGLSAAELQAVARDAIRICRDGGARILLNAEPELAEELGADGVHLSAARLLQYRSRPVSRGMLCAASCHGQDDLSRAHAVGVDFAVLSPVRATTSHPQAEPLGWARFQDLVWDVPLPVYALGGLGPTDLERALAARAQGFAAIRALWPRG